MATRRTLDFLPSIFQSDTNRKFLNATLDQLISEPDFVRLNGYVGRKFAPTYKTSDNYVSEFSKDRQSYQLEPSVVIKDSSNQVDFYSGYTDLINKLSYYGGATADHNRLFSSEYYTYDGLFDYDKFVNFSQYYWLPNGPAPITISAQEVPTQATYHIGRNTVDNVLTFEGKTSGNPEIVLSRGGLYKFAVSSPGHKFWIQTEPGISGKKRVASNISTRTIFGVTNNGAESGLVEFNVPLNDEQDFFLLMPMLPSVDYAVDIPFSLVHGTTWQQLLTDFDGFDGITINPESKTLIFLNPDDSEDAWILNRFFIASMTGNVDNTEVEVITSEPHHAVSGSRIVIDGAFENEYNGIFTVGRVIDENTFYINLTTVPTSLNATGLLAGSRTVDPTLRRGVYRIRIVDEIMTLDYIRDVPTENRVYSRLGKEYANIDFYKTDAGYFAPVPILTAQLDTLYYQDSSDPKMFGRIKLVDNVVDAINVDTSIIGFKNYTAPNGLEFTNGLIIDFDSTVEPAFYANKRFVVEGVGKGIRLVDFDNLVCSEEFVKINSVPIDTEPFNIDNYDEPYRGPAVPEYITINRGSKDLNGWSRHNRWFHTDVIIKSAEFNNQTPLFDQGTRAQRPIIEFDPDLQLLNSGRIGKKPVDHIESVSTDAFNQIQHQNQTTINGHTYQEGQRVLFVNDKDPLVRSQVYLVATEQQVDSSYQTFWDGVGTGVIDVRKPVLSYTSDSIPVQNQDLMGDWNEGDLIPYYWIVKSNDNLLTATEISHLGWPTQDLTAAVTNVEYLGNNQYKIYFTAPDAVINFYLLPNPNDSIYPFIDFNVNILGTGGIATVDGTDTTFLSELEPGTDLYTADDRYIGRVLAVMKDHKVQLETRAPFSVYQEFDWKYKKPKIQLIISEDPHDALEKYDMIVARSGPNAGISYWYNGDAWAKSQMIGASNQEPLFDVFDFNNASFSTYASNKFVGTKVFAYKKGTGTNDSVLGFPLSYSNVNSTVADISFENSFDFETFTWVNDSGTVVTQKVNAGYISEIVSRYESKQRNIWTTAAEPTKQYQVISKTYTGRTNHFEIDVLPVAQVEIPNIKVFLNNTLLNSSNYILTSVGGRKTVKISANLLTAGDKVDILIYSDTVSKTGYYQIPSNLDYNSENVELSSINLGQIRNHLIAINQNLGEVTGQVPGYSNLRDFAYKDRGGNILQHSAPVIYPGLFLIHEQANFMNGLDYARREYTKFKNKFLELAYNMKGISINDIRGSVDAILSSINAVKNETFPWYYSDMVPYGETNTITYRVLDTNQRYYKISAIFDETVLQSRAVLVYHGNTQLIKGVDYTFPQDRMAIKLADHVVVQTNDPITICEYASTDGNYIPETPTKLGLYPKFIPGIYTDDTYREPVEVIQGHDGSLTLAFGDFRDQMLLELELRIYNNIKQDSNHKAFDLRSLIPGKFRSTDYTVTEFNRLISTGFLRWIGLNKVDYITHKYFEAGDPFTYNYNGSKDQDGKNLPGWWRGIYKYFYDTDRPHTHPWEMLGFTEQPAWWVDTYGPAPYTLNNNLLWTDLEAGIVRGAIVTTLAQYARPGLSTMIPVDEHGNLMPPLGRIVGGYNASTTSSSFQIGDGGPAESAWKRTSEYPFALQAAAAVMKPALYFGTLFDTADYYKDSVLGQYKTVTTNRRVNPADIRLNGEKVSGTITRASGYTNWIIDYMTNLGLSSTIKLRNILDNIDVHLTYKVGGYTDQNYLTVLAEQYSPSSTNASVIIPNESYNIHLNKSVPIERIAYSAVIVEKTPTGFAVSGYNLSNPYFTVVPSETAGASYVVNVENLAGVIYKNYRKQKLVIPYGHEFTTRQQVVDFLVSYQRFLFAQGFVFDEFDEELAISKDWILSVKEFLTWTLQGWKPGNVLVLSPVSTTLKMYTVKSVVDEITNEPNGSRILDPNFGVIRTTDLTVLRDGDLFKVQAVSGQTIAFAELNLTQFEHVLVFDNSTVFNDIIYKPESGSRQYRLKLVGNKTNNWDGSLNPAGFIYNKPVVNDWQQGHDYRKGDIVGYKSQYYVATGTVPAQETFNINYWKLINKSDIKTGLLPNFATSAQKFINVYDTDSSLLDVQMDRMSSGLIGFRDRSYLTDLNVDRTSQRKFYQGYIQTKGTPKAIDSLLGVKFSNLGNDINFYEEWGFRVGEYGALDSNQSIELALNEETSNDNPTGYSVVADGAAVEEGMVGIEYRDVWAKPDGKFAFLNRTTTDTDVNDIQTAGYPNINDIDATLFDSSDFTVLNDKIDEIFSGYLIWVAKDKNQEWNIYRTTETNTTVTKISYGLDAVGTITLTNPQDFTAGQIILIKNLHTLFNTFYTVETVVDRRTITVSLTTEQANLIKQDPVTGTGILFVLDSVRFPTPSDIANYTPPHGWKDNDIVWVDKDDNYVWGVYQKTSPWQYDQLLGIKNLGQTPRTDSYQYGSAVKMDRVNRISVVGATGFTAAGWLHAFDSDNPDREVSVIQSYIPDLSGLGSSVDVNNRLIVSGAPTSRNNVGYVLVYQLFAFKDSIYYRPSQAIVCPTLQQGARFGYSVSQSTDGKWLYVGSPGESTVYVYEYNNIDFKTFQDDLIQEKIYSGYPLPDDYTNDIRALAVYINERLLIAGEDYTLTDGRIFLEEPVSSNAVDAGMIIINQRGYYNYQSSITAGNVTDNFGLSVKSNKAGDQVVIGAPDATYGQRIQAGKVYVYYNNGTSTHLINILTASTPTYRARLGFSVDFSPNNDSVIAGAPGYSTVNYSGGAVYRYINIGKTIGLVSGTISNPVVNVGDQLKINDVIVTFTGTNLQSVINDINNADIVGVQASADSSNRIVISSNSLVTYNKLNISGESGTPISSLGLRVFDSAQIITKPINSPGENFGNLVRLSDDALTLLVSSAKGTAEDYAQYDSETTYLDGNSTRILDITTGSGAVYVLNFLPSSINSDNKYGNFVFSQELVAPTLANGDLFGISADINDERILVGARDNDAEGLNTGRVFQFVNPTSTRGWNKIREDGPRVNINAINGISLYNKTTQARLVTLDYIDPAKGNFLGIAQQDLDYITARDPAVYNVGPDIKDTALVDFHWSENEVGKTWWDLRAVRYIDYEQGDLSYRLNNWGRLFPGSEVRVYEWVESNVLPSQYVNNGNIGTPLFEDDSAYVESVYVDQDTGLIKTKYYYWVRSITDVPVGSGRRLSAKAIEMALEDPKSQNIPYAAILSDSSIGIYNCLDYISGSNTLLKIDYDTVYNENVIHSEYELVQEGNPSSSLPGRIVNKLIDSIASVDITGKPVPDPLIKESQKLGLGLRPRQTLVKDRYAALKNIAQYVNGVFKNTTAAYKLQGSQVYNKAYFFARDAEPASTEYNHRVENLTERGYILVVPGDLVLVAKDSSYFDRWTIYEVQDDGSFKLKKNQSVNTTNLWNYDDWYAEGYSKDTKPTYIVEQFKDIAKLIVRDGDIVRVENSATGGFELYYYPTSTEPTLVAVKNGTLKLNDYFWNQEVTDAGFDNDTFSGQVYDLDYSHEVRNIMLGLINDIFIGDLEPNNNKLWFSIIEYILSEQTNVDWAFKTSFISVVHKLRELGQYANYIKDNHTYYEDYINEVKPYRTKLRDYSIEYSGNDTALTKVTDFDVPGYYDTTLKRFHSPSGEVPSVDEKALLRPEYQDWANNFNYGVESILVSAKGSGYSQAPAISIIANNDAGTGAKAEAVINDIDGSLLQIIVTDPGYGYRNVPHIIINGDGTGAVAKAVLVNKKIRNIKTVMKFDRVSYTAAVTEWVSGKSYVLGDMVSFENRGYRCIVANSDLVFTPGNYKAIKDAEYTNANDRIAARYNPTKYQIPKEYDANGNIDLTRLVPGLVSESVALQNVPQAYNDSLVQSYAPGDIGSTLQPESINISGGTLTDIAHSYAPEELVAGTTYDTVNMKVLTKISGNTVTLGHRISMLANGEHEYRAIGGANCTVLSQDLHYDDDEIYVADASKLTQPNPSTLTPGVVYINGEKITYYARDIATNKLSQIGRGVGITSTPAVHASGSRLEDASSSLSVPTMTTVVLSSYNYKRTEPVFEPAFTVSGDINLVKYNLEVVIGNNLLTYEQDYTLELYADTAGSYHVLITFTESARANFAEGIVIAARYTQEKIWLKQGTTTAANGTGLEGSDTAAAVFLKARPYF